MRNSLKVITLMAFTMFVVSGCTWNNRDTGTAVGAVAGGVAGNVLTGGSTVGTIVGAGGGALIGNQLSR